MVSKEVNVFNLLKPELKELVVKRFGKPTPIQMAVIPKILERENVLMISQTGSGKTEACLLPVFNEMVKETLKPISTIYICPLRSLNRDLLKRIIWWSEKLNFDVSVRHGDTSQYERSMQAANPADMFITTPETLQAMLVGKRMRNHLKNVRWVVVDEIHELIDNKRGIQLSIGLERLKELAEKDKIQIVGLSATIGSPERVAKFLTAGKPCKIVNTVESRDLEISVESPRPKLEDNEIAEKLFMGKETSARLRRVLELIRNNKSVLTFTNTREFAEVLSSRLKAMSNKIPIETHHSSLSKEVRIDAEERFKQEKIKSLICTSSLELGIDIGSINLVLQYMSPRQVCKLLQRVGRSGHKVTDVSSGVVISTDSDDCFEASVIAKLGSENRIEPTAMYEKALDVLGHQVVGLSLEEYKIPLNRAYRIVKRALPYKNLTRDEFIEVCGLLQKLGFLWLDTKYSEEPVLKRRKNAWLYYYSNLSTIPDVKNYKIVDVVSHKPVGTLDAEFIALHGHVGTSFIVKGQAWRILDIQENKILVEPEENIRAAIPAWEGELIPVPFNVAQGIGFLRREITEMLKKNFKKGEIIKSLTEKYPITREVANKLFKTIKKQVNYGFVPDEKNILIENWEDYVIIHSPFGSLVNETLGRILTTMLTNKLGSVGLQTDPYRIIIKLPGYQYRHVVEALEKINPEEIQGILEITLPNTELFTWKFIQVCQRFGIISRNADYGKAYMRKIISVYSQTPPYREALNEIFQDNLDVEGAKKVLKKIKKGKIRITVKKGLSYLGESGLSKKYEIVPPDRPDREIFKVFEKRLLETRVRLICCNCGEYSVTYRVKDIPEKIQCSKCKARLIGIIKPWDTEKERILKRYLKGQGLAREEGKTVNEILDSGSLVISHGKDAIKSLAGRGVGVKTASRILRKNLKGRDLLKEILNAEKQFAKTKRFWR